MSFEEFIEDNNARIKVFNCIIAAYSGSSVYDVENNILIAKRKLQFTRIYFGDIEHMKDLSENDTNNIVDFFSLSVAIDRLDIETLAILISDEVYADVAEKFILMNASQYVSYFKQYTNKPHKKHSIEFPKEWKKRCYFEMYDIRDQILAAKIDLKTIEFPSYLYRSSELNKMFNIFKRYLRVKHDTTPEAQELFGDFL